MTPQQVREAEQSSLLFHAALTQLGAQSITDALSLYDDVPPVANVSTARVTERWLAAAVKYVMLRRLRARDMALAYYRYQRALATGTTIALPGQEAPPYMTLPELKRQFEAYLDPADVPPGDEQDDDTEALEADESDSERIDVEEIDGLEDDLDALEQETEAQVRENLIVLGPVNQDRKTRRRGSRYVESAEVVDEIRAEAHREAALRQASAAEHGVLNGARGPLYLAASKDDRAIGYVRVSKTGTPCGFCAMLISRQVVYKSAKTAGGEDPADVDKWHPNCHCIAIPVFSMAQYQSRDIFALNREYHALWNEHIKDEYSGDEALTEWRRLIRERAKSRESLEAAA